MTARCYVCESIDIAADADMRSPTCEACKPARDHVVSMQTGRIGILLAICQCGWQTESSGRDRRDARDRQVRQHWRAMIRAAGAA
jgi:hypothetical protein